MFLCHTLFNMSPALYDGGEQGYYWRLEIGQILFLEIGDEEIYFWRFGDEPFLEIGDSCFLIFGDWRFPSLFLEMRRLPTLFWEMNFQTIQR